MNVAELAKQIGKTRSVRFEQLVFRCRIVNVKSAYGNVRYLVEPLKGFGQQWVDESKLQPEAGQKAEV